MSVTTMAPAKTDQANSATTLRIVLPDWANLDTELASKRPFALWEVGDQPLLYHWLDYAVNHGFTGIKIYCADRPSSIREAMEDATLWPLKWEIIPVTNVFAVTADDVIKADGLPWPEHNPTTPENGWELLDYWFRLEREWFEHTFRQEDVPDINLAIGRNCNIHPTAKLNMPCHLGDNVQIGAGCEIGPYATIGSDSMLSGENIVRHSRIAPRTYLAANTELNQCYLEGALLANLRYRAVVPNLDRFIADGWESGEQKPGIFERATALGVWCALKIRDVLLNGAGERASIETFRGVTLSIYRDAPIWKQRLPLLLRVVRGDCFLFGVLPRTQEQFSKLSQEWQDIISASPIGVFSYADTHGCHSASEDIEAVHAVFQATQPREALLPVCRSFVLNILRGKIPCRPLPSPALS